MPPALQSLNQPAGRILMDRTPVHRPAVAEPATRLAAPCQDLICDVQVVVKLFYISVRGPFCHASCQMSQAVTQGGRPPVALHSLLSAAAAAAESNFSDQGLVHQMHFPFLFVCLIIYSGNFENCKLNSLRRIISRILCGTEQRVAFFTWVLIKTYFVVLLCVFFFPPTENRRNWTNLQPGEKVSVSLNSIKAFLK